MSDRVCLDCKIVITGHRTRKRCPTCAEKLRKRPLGKLSPEQISIVKTNCGLISSKEIAMMANTSVTNLKRWARDEKISLAYYNYSKEVIKEVCAYYEKHGKRKTQEFFPEVSVESIVERYKIFAPRCIKWKDGEIIQALKMSCFIPFDMQAKIFNRPRAFAGSITSLWKKRLQGKPTTIHGLLGNKAKLFASNKCPAIKLPILRVINGDTRQARKIFLWVDLENHLKDDCPEFIKDAIRTMAEFQRWIFKSDNPRNEIERMLQHGSK